MMGSEQHNELDFPGGLSRTVSFPNFFRGFLDFHQLEEGIEHLPLNFTSSSDVTSSGNANITSDGLVSSSSNYIPESDNTSGWLLQRRGTKNNDGHNNDSHNNDITPVVKLLRCETWAGGFTSVAGNSLASDSAADINANVESASCDKNIYRTSENSAVTPKFESSIRPVSVVSNQSQSHVADVSPVAASVNVLPSLHELTPTAGQHRSKILSALVTHDKSVAGGNKTSSSGRLRSPDIVQPQQQQHPLPVNHNMNAHSAERKGLFGMPNRVKVSPREINMMSPTSF